MSPASAPAVRTRILPNLVAGRCLRTAPASACSECLGACPAGALAPGSPVAFDVNRCQGCGACLHRCPAGAFEGDDHVDTLLECVARLGEVRELEMACSWHPAGYSSGGTVVQTEGCLAALGPSALVRLAGAGVPRLTLQLDACDDCPVGLGKVRPEIERSAALAAELLAARGGPEQVEARSDRPAGPAHRVVQAAPRAMSRRDLFRVFLSPPELPSEPGPLDPKPPPERARLLEAVRGLPPVSIGPSDAPLQLPGARLAVEATCTACGACARACPTRALRLEMPAAEAFRLIFTPGACTGCDLCLGTCLPNSLHRAGSASLADLLRTEPVLLASGMFRPCPRCGVRFAGPAIDGVCPTCDFRRHNPFGSRLPPGFRSLSSPS